jgi:putative membrane protein insertion efficiency factor
MKEDISRVLWMVGWPVRTALVGLVLVYRRTVGPLVAGRCRFEPSCSSYGLEAIRVHGAAKGTALTAWRILRCSPVTAGGLDPVPPGGPGRSEAGVR